MPASARRSVYLIETYWLPRTLSCLSSTRWGGEYAVDLAGHVTLQAAHDLAFGQPLQGPASDIGSGPLVGSHSAHDDHVQGGVGLAVASAVETVALRLPTRCGHIMAIGQTPHIMAKLASERSRSGLSPTATITAPAFSVPTPSSSSRLGASSSTTAQSGTMNRSSSAISSLMSRILRARDFRESLVATTGSR